MWGDKSEPVIQLLHFWFCLGATVMPFMIEPFLNEANVFTNTSMFNNSQVCEYDFLAFFDKL